MLAAVYPSNDTVCIDERCAGKLSRVLQLRRSPVLTKTCRAIFFPALCQSRVTKEPKQIVVFESHCFIRALVRVFQTSRCIAELPTKARGFIGRAHYNESHRDARVFEVLLNLAQLRERLAEKRSTDVPEPH